MPARMILIMAVLALAPRVWAACRPFGTQLECALGSSRVVIGTQRATPPTCARSFVVLSFDGDVCLQNDPVPAETPPIRLEDFGTDPQPCRRIGNETYCY